MKLCLQFCLAKSKTTTYSLFNGSSGTSVRIAVMNQPCTVPTLPGSDAVLHPPMKTCRPRLQGPTPRVRIGESKLASGMRFAPCPMAVLLSTLVHAAEPAEIWLRAVGVIFGCLMCSSRVLVLQLLTVHSRVSQPGLNKTKAKEVPAALFSFR